MVIRKNNIFSKIDNNRIEQFECKIGYVLPKSYRQFLLENNVCKVFPQDFNNLNTNTHISAIYGELYGLDSPDYCNLLAINSYYSNFLENQYLAIGRDFGDNQICLSLNEPNEVMYWSNQDKEFDLIGLNFAVFLNTLYRYQRWENGNIEDKLYCDIEDDLPEEVEDHIRIWLPIDYVFRETGWNLLETAVVHVAYSTIELLHSLNAPIGNAYNRAKQNFNDPELEDNYECKEVYYLIKKLYNIPDH